ncbi:enterobactin exporter EntS [Rubripirellula amarantea]|uniref:Enterobactin exporter EntS n=1 Tax=Rubripirellula amarantea TaxID=2527999 RepID=A0A5C5WLC2_9BACT|nr:MFS transporter [Rubripirellula amarantea]TWT50783.1 enterobactin exporter EntS [Rubripirellula amarantea]
MSSGNTIEAKHASVLAPLSIPIFRLFWFASIFSNLGTWIHEVGASWLMTQLDSSPEMVAAVRVSMAIPMMLMAIPAGVIADRIDRRKLIIVTQLFLFSTASTLAMLTYSGAVTAWLLLSLTFLTGMGMVLHVLTWQSAIPELVSRAQLSRAVALGSISFNLARSIGPAIGGVMIAMAGTWVTFAANAFSFAGVLAVAVRWNREGAVAPQQVSVKSSLTEAVAHLRATESLKHSLVRLAMFMIPASAMWSLLPLLSRQQLLWAERGYGFLVTTLGLGAVVGATIIHSLHRRFGMDRTIRFAMGLFAIALLILAHTTNGLAASTVTFVLGGAWMMTLTTLNSTTQLSLSNALRARGMSFYYATMAGSMSTGAFVWGQTAGTFGLVHTLSVASILLMILTITSRLFPICVSEEVDA